MEIKPFNLNILPRKSMTWEEFLSSAPKNSIALDGVVLGPPCFNQKTNHVNFNHHDFVVREATMSTSMQVYFAIKGNMMDSFTDGNKITGNIFINDTDQDTSFAVWLLKNYKKFEGCQSIPNINRLLSLNDRWDITGGAFPMNLDDSIVRQHAWVFKPYTDLRKSGKLAIADENIMYDNLISVMNRLDKFLMGESLESDLDTRHKILYDSPLFKIVDEIGGSEARHYLFKIGMKAFISQIAKRPDGRFVYSVGKKSQYINFPVEKLYNDFNKAEGVDKNNGWNGSDIVGGSSREKGSGLSWEQLKEITNNRLKSEGLIF